MTDDRGNSCDVAALSGRQLGVRALGIAALEDPHTKQELVSTRRLELTWAIAGGVIASAAWQLLWLVWPVLGPCGLIGGFVLLAPAAGMLTWWLTLGSVRRRRFRRLADVYLGSGRCASCAYALAGLAAEEDGCVVCPECGAAWRADRLGPERA